MRLSFARRELLACSAALLLGLVFAPTAAAGQPDVSLGGPQHAATELPSPEIPGLQLWVALEGSAIAPPFHLPSEARAIAISPDGAKVFVSGRMDRYGTGEEYGTVAYNAATGARLWVRFYDQPGFRDDHPNALRVSPDGTKVFVTGESLEPGGCDEARASLSGSRTQYDVECADYATIAYDASSGSTLWVQRYNGPGKGFNEATALGVSPDGSTVYVTGTSWGLGWPPRDYTTIAYSASTGATLWVQRYDSGDGDDYATALGLSPDGTKVFVTGQSAGPNLTDYLTIAYDASTGTPLWLQRYNGPINGCDGANALAVSLDGTKVFVTGEDDDCLGPGDFATVAYDASSGNQLWVARWNGPANSFDGGVSIGVSPDGTEVFVTGLTAAQNGFGDYATLAYQSSNGAQLWVQIYNGPGNYWDFANSLGVSPDGATVFVTGSSGGGPTNDDYATIAYDASSGTQVWLQRYNGPSNWSDRATALVVNADGTKVIVTGASGLLPDGSNYATVAYSTR